MVPAAADLRKQRIDFATISVAGLPTSMSEVAEFSDQIDGYEPHGAPRVDGNQPQRARENPPNV